MANDEVGKSGGAAPSAIVREKARPSIVWLIPLIAAVVSVNETLVSTTTTFSVSFCCC